MLVKRGVITCVLVLAMPAIAHAEPSKDECVDADTQAQVARRAGKFRDARAQLDICVSQSCPASVRADCTERLDEVLRNAPTLVFDVKDASGADIPSTAITLDGKPLVARLDGKAVPVDTGEHTLVFTSQGHLPRTLHVVVSDGDKDRRVAIVLGQAAEEQPTSSPTTEAPTHPTTPVANEPETPMAGHPLRIPGVVIGIIGLVGVGLGIGFTVATYSSWNASQQECSAAVAPSCPSHDQAVIDHDNAATFATAATISFIAGGALAAGGLVLAIAAPRSEPHAARLRVAPSFARGGAGVFLTGEF
jgi:hypothetical protein